MKKIFLFSILIIGFQYSYCQTTSNKQDKFTTHQNALAALLQLQSVINKANKTTSGIPTERVKAQSTRDSVTGPLSDSVSLKYSAYRGSMYDFNTMIYAYNYTYSQTPMFNFEGIFCKPQVEADTYRHWTINPYTLAYGLFESTYSGYDIGNNLVKFKTQFVDSVLSQNTSNINNFNTANNITNGDWFNSISGITDSAFKQYFTYNIANKLTKDSIYEYHLGGWHLVSKTIYTYDVANNLILIDCYAQTGTTYDSFLAEQTQYINTYDGSNRLLTVATNQFNGATLAASARDTFGYTGTHTFHTTWKDYQYDNINHYWAPMLFMSKSLNTLGLPDTVNIKGFDSLMNAWVPQTFKTVRYDTFNNPDTLFEFDINFGSFPSLPDFTTVYYYDIFNDFTYTNNHPIIEQPVSIYPNPATNIVTISKLNITNTALITLLNVNGQCVMKEKVNVEQQTTQISVRDLQLGVYWIIIQDSNGTIIDKQTIIKE